MLSSSASIISFTSCLSCMICISRSRMTSLCFPIVSSCSRHNCSRLILFARDLFVFFRSDKLAYNIMYSLLTPISVIVIILDHLIFLAHSTLLTDQCQPLRPRIQDQPAAGSLPLPVSTTHGSRTSIPCPPGLSVRARND